MKTTVIDNLDLLINFYKENSPKKTTVFDIFIEETQKQKDNTNNKKDKKTEESTLDIDALLKPSNDSKNEGGTDNASVPGPADTVTNEPSGEGQNATNEVDPSIQMPPNPENNENSVLGQLKNEKDLKTIKDSITLLFRKIEKDLIDEVRTHNNEEKLEDFYATVGTLPSDDATKEDWENFSKKLKQWIRLSLDQDFFVPAV